MRMNKIARICIIIVLALVISLPLIAMNNISYETEECDHLTEYCEHLIEVTRVNINLDGEVEIGTRSGWPWTDCSNVLGHSWSAWGTWRSTGPTNHSRFCTESNYPTCFVPSERTRWCTRTNCNMGQREQTNIWINCGF